MSCNGGNQLLLLALHVRCPAPQTPKPWHPPATSRPRLQVGALPDVYSELEINFFLLRRLLGVRSKEGEKQEKVRGGGGAAGRRRNRQGLGQCPVRPTSASTLHPNHQQQPLAVAAPCPHTHLAALLARLRASHPPPHPSALPSSLLALLACLPASGPACQPARPMPALCAAANGCGFVAVVALLCRSAS